MFDSIGLPELLIAVPLVALLAVFVVYLLTLARTLEKCSPQSRTLSPYLVWLILIPYFGVAWHFIVVWRMSASLRNEYERRGLPLPNPAPGRAVGLALCVLEALAIIPMVALVTAIPALICWLVYWSRIAEYSKALGPGQTGSPK